MNPDVSAGFPIPVVDQDTQPFWDGCARSELLLQCCRKCQTWWHPPSPICPNCFSAEYDWTPSSGKGTVYTFSVIHHPFRRNWEALVPYVVGVIELEEGPHILSNVVGVEPDAVEVGMRVAVSFEQMSDTISLPLFRPEAYR